jgi:hypothetical protein
MHEEKDKGKPFCTEDPAVFTKQTPTKRSLKTLFI